MVSRQTGSSGGPNAATARHSNFLALRGDPPAEFNTPTQAPEAELAEPSLGELARVITAGACIEASFKRGKSEAGMDAYQVRTVRRESTIEECGNTIGYTGIR